MKKSVWMVELVLLISAMNSSAERRSDDPESVPSKRQNTSSYIRRLLKTSQRFFLLTHSGKLDTSNFLQTVRSFLTNDEELLAKYSLVYLNFADFNLHFLKGFRRQIQEVGLAHGIKIFKRNPALDQFTQLISGLSRRRQEHRESVIVLVNEYDWPMRLQLTLEDVEEAKEMHEFLKSFFALLRANASKLKLVFVTGAMRVTPAQFRNGDNIFLDVTRDPEIEALRGLSKSVPQNRNNSNFEEVLEAMKKVYRNYNLCGSLSSANQGSDSVDIRQHWHGSSPPAYIFDHFGGRYLVADAFSKIRVSRDHLLTPYDPNNEFPIEIFMILNGYLTCCGYDNETNEFIIDYPSADAKLDFVRIMWLSHIRVPTQFAIAPTTLKLSMIEGRFPEFVQHLNGLLALNLRYPEEYRLGKVVASILDVCQIACKSGQRFRRQDSSLAGDIDLETLDLPINYVVEFKWLKTAEKAFEKLLRYSNVTSFQRAYTGRSVYLVGINFGFVGDGIMVNEWIKVNYSDGKCNGLESSNEEYTKKFSRITEPNLFCNTLYRYESS